MRFLFKLKIKGPCKKIAKINVLENEKFQFYIDTWLKNGKKSIGISMKFAFHPC